MSLINELLSAGIIDADDAGLLNTNAVVHASNINLLSILRNYFLKKLFPSQHEGGFAVTLHDTELISTELIEDKDHADAVNQLLDILAAKQIISNQVWQKLQDKSIPNTVGGNIFILHLSIELTNYYDNFTIEKQLEFADLLRGDTKSFTGCSMIDDIEHDKLLLDVKAGKLNTYLDFYNYSYCCKLLDIDPSSTTRQVLKQLAKTLNKLMHDSFNIAGLTFREEDFNGQPSYDNRQIMLTLDTQVRLYSRKYTYSQNGHHNKSDIGQLIESVLLLTNDVLVDYAALYRFTKVTSHLHPDLFPAQKGRYAICRVQLQNMPAFNFYTMRRRSLFYSPQPVFCERLSYRRIEYLIHHFRNCGLLDHLNEQIIQDCIAQIQNHTYGNADELLTVFPGATAVVNINHPTLQPPYLQLLTALDVISKGKKSFTDIKDNTPINAAVEDGISFKVKFVCNGIQHSIKCEYYHNQFDESVLFYICQQILKQSHPDLVLLSLTSQDANQHVYAVINRKQTEYLKKANINLGMQRFC